jgi:hypothetical protein
MEGLKYRASQAPNDGSLRDESVDRSAAQASDERILGDRSCISNRNKPRLEIRLPPVESTRTPVLIATNDDLIKVVVLSEQREPKDLLCSANRASRATGLERRGCARQTTPLFVSCRGALTVPHAARILFVLVNRMRAYLDYNSTTPVDPEVLAAMLPFLAENFGNASSIHSP